LAKEFSHFFFPQKFSEENYTLWQRNFHIFFFVAKENYAFRKPTMGWLRLVGSFKLQVCFAEYGLFSRALLQKRPVMFRSLLIVATPYSMPTYICISKMIQLFCYGWCKTLSCVCHDSYICATWLNCDMGGARLHSFLRVPWLIHMCDMTQLWYGWCETSLIPACAMTHTCARHDSSVVWAIWVMTHPCVCHDSCICATWFITGMLASCNDSSYMRGVRHDSFMWEIWVCAMTHSWCAMTHSCVRHVSPQERSHCATTLVICVVWDITHSCVCHDSFMRVPWLIHACAMTHSYVCHDSSQERLQRATTLVIWVVSPTGQVLAHELVEIQSILDGECVCKRENERERLWE